MFTSRTRTAWAGAGLLLALTVATPVWADDVELLLSNPAASNAAKPNILFILDSSGSMTTIEKSLEPYNGESIYDGDCSEDFYYWTTGSSIPSCGSYYKIYKTAFVCDQGITQMDAAGRYTDTMSMYRSSWWGGWKWQTLSAYTNDKAVECAADSGVHGYGNNPKKDTYAQIGSNTDPYTSDASREVDWGVSPTHRVITIYDTNYLNWYNYAPSTSMSRTDIVKAVTKNVLGSINDVNVGFMRFHRDAGGPVVHGIKDLDANRAAANAIVDALPASGYTPLSETLYEAALYWSGLEGYYGGLDDTDKDALDSWNSNTGEMNYKQPAEYACSKNFTVLLTDGEPTRDTGAYDLVPLLPKFTSVMGRSQCDGGNVDGACLDDISEYLSKADINPVLAGKQDVTTFTIGFAVDLPILKRTAELSGGEYYLASDVKTLTAAMTDIVTNIFDRDISFTAPAVAVNAFNRTQHMNDLYISVFRATDKVHWPGNMKKYLIQDTSVKDANLNDAVDPDTGYFADTAKNFWSREATPDGADVYRGGTANLLPNPALRKLYTNNGVGNLTSTTNHVSTGNILAFTEADFGLTGAEGEPTMAQLIDWARGVDVKDDDNDPDTTVRYAMGDTLHAQPAAVVYGQAGGATDIVLFNATNDGYLHAVDADTGKELWSFIPKELLPNLHALFVDDNVSYKNYGLDGDVVSIVADENNDGIIDPSTDFVYIVFGMRRGGNNYYLIDVTTPSNPVLRWVRTFPESGQSWSTPVVAKIDINSAAQTSSRKAVLVIGGGYDTAHDATAHPATPDYEGASIFMLDIETGNMIWRAGTDNFANFQNSMMTRAIPSRIRVIDINGDGYADRMYAADLGGQVWRFDITNGNVPNQLVAGGVIAQLGAEGLNNPSAADTRRFYSEPDLSMFVDKRHDRRYLAINIGSGYRAHPLDNSATDRFYSIRDPRIFDQMTQSQYDSYPIIKDGDLIDVAGTSGTVVPADGDGWKLTLSPTQKILSASITFDNAVYFVSFEPEANNEDPCQAGLSVNRLYRVDIVNGDPVMDNGEPVPEDGGEADLARVTRLEQGGIAPKPTFFFPSPSDPNCTGMDCAPPPVGCVGVECFDPGFPNFPVRTLWTQDGID